MALSMYKARDHILISRAPRAPDHIRAIGVVSVTVFDPGLARRDRVGFDVELDVGPLVIGDVAVGEENISAAVVDRGKGFPIGFELRDFSGVADGAIDGAAQETVL